jgi:hypothetical protein
VAARTLVVAAAVLAACGAPADPAPEARVATPTTDAAPSPPPEEPEEPDAAIAASPPPPAPEPQEPPPPEPAPAKPTPTPAGPTLYFPPSQPFASSVVDVVGHPAEDRMRGVSWREGCPVPLEDLRYVTVSHVGMDGAVRTGELVVRTDVAPAVVTAFRRMYEVGFPIQRMRLVDDYGADDGASMRANNTSAFNCRTVAGTDRWSNHAYGAAVDINPLHNPYVKGGTVDPPEGAAYADRSNRRPGMLHAGTAELAAWTDQGWDWGGFWSSGQDYQHVSATGG